MICAGCGKALSLVYAVGVHVPKDGSKKIPYSLCSECVQEAKANPQRVADRIELRIAPTLEGHA